MSSGLLRRLSPFLVPVILFAAGYGFFAYRLSFPYHYIYDEVYHAYTAAEYVRGNHDAYLWNTKATRPDAAYTWNHPPAGVLLIAGGIALFGDESFGWRISSAVFGAAGIALVYFLALSLTRRRGIAVLAAGLLLADGLYFVQSRTGMLDTFETVFMLGALYAFHKYLSALPDRVGRWLAVTGLFLGLAIATKWSAAYPAVCIGVIALVRSVVQARGGSAAEATERPRFPWAKWIRSVGVISLAMGFLPAMVYLIAYVPFFLTGHSVAQFVELQNQILYYHQHLQATHPYASKWWQWPLAYRPVWYSIDRWGDRVANVYANSNPILSIAMVPAVLAAMAALWRQRAAGLLVFLVGFFGQWLPWALVRRISFAYHFLPATPFGCIAVAVVLGWLWARGTYGRTLAVGYVAAVAGAFAFFYPIYTAIPLTQHAFDLRMWLPSWR